MPPAKKTIAVLGAGPMGLAVAYQLIKDGHHPVIFEADDRIGGMAAAFDFNGTLIERFYHFHCTTDQDFLALLEELGIGGKMRWGATKTGFYHQGRLYRWGDPLALLTFPALSLMAKIRYGLHLFISTKRHDWRALDKQRAVNWIKKWVGAEAYDMLWKNLFDYKFYSYAPDISAAWVWNRIHRFGRSRYNIFHEKLGHLDGGSNTLLDAMKAFITSHDGEIRLQSPVSRIVIENNAVKGIETGGAILPFDTVISTVPLPYVPRMMPDLPHDILEKFSSIKNIAVVCIIVKLKRRLTDYFWVNIHDPEMDIPGLIEYTNLRPMDAHIVYVPFYMPGEHPKFKEDDSAFIGKAKHYLTRINPDLKEDDIIDIHASRYRYAQPICPPGFLEMLPPPDLPIDGLYVADTSYYYPEDRGISQSARYGRMLARLAFKETAS